MKTRTPTLAARLRIVATLLLTLPAVVAAACFAHGHGAVGAGVLLAVIAAAIAAGAAGAYLALAALGGSSRRRQLPAQASGAALATVSHS